MRGHLHVFTISALCWMVLGLGMVAEAQQQDHVKLRKHCPPSNNCCSASDPPRTITLEPVLVHFFRVRLASQRVPKDRPLVVTGLVSLTP